VLDGVAVGVVDLRDRRLEVADPGRDPVPLREGVDPVQTLSADRPVGAAEELHHSSLAWHDGGEPSEDERSDDQQRDADCYADRRPDGDDASSISPEPISTPPARSTARPNSSALTPGADHAVVSTICAEPPVGPLARSIGLMKCATLDRLVTAR
jgi:hypothetical protein